LPCPSKDFGTVLESRGYADRQAEQTIEELPGAVPGRVTFTPMGCSSRNLKLAIDFFARVTMALTGDQLKVALALRAGSPAEWPGRRRS